MGTTVWLLLLVYWITFACRETWQKWILSHSKKKWGASLLISGETLIAGLLLLAFSLRHGLPARQEGFWWFVLATALLNPILFWCNVKAKQQTDLSAVEPILVGGVATFVYVAERVTSVLLGRPSEPITLYGCAGLAIMGLGVYVALLKPKQKFTEPLRAIFRQHGVAAAFAIGFGLAVSENILGEVNRWAVMSAGILLVGVIINFARSIKTSSLEAQEVGIRFAFLGAFLGSWSSIFDNYSVKASSDGTFPAALVLIVIGAVHAVRAYKKREHEGHIPRNLIGNFLGRGTLTAIGIGAYWLSLHTGQITYISPLKRAALLFTLPMAFIILRERANMKNRFLGAILVLIGTFFLAFGK